MFAYLNRSDKYHDISVEVFRKIRGGSEVSLCSLTLVELELIYKSSGYEEYLPVHLAILSTLPFVRYVPLTVDIVLTSTVLRKDHGLSFFDSHYAAAALHGDGKIISTDQAYEKVPGLELLAPEKYQLG